MMVSNTALRVMLITLNNQRDLSIDRSHVLHGWLSHYTRNSSWGDDQLPVPQFAGIVQELEQQLRTIVRLSAHAGIANE